MSEQWKSQNKYFCPYCKVYIYDNKPTRLHHESGAKHKANMKKFLEETVESGIKKEKEDKKRQDIMRQIEQKALVQFALESNDEEFKKKVAEMQKAPKLEKANDAEMTKKSYYGNSTSVYEGGELVRPTLPRKKQQKPHESVIGAIPEDAKRFIAETTATPYLQDEGSSKKRSLDHEITHNKTYNDYEHEHDDEDEDDYDLYDKTRKALKREEQKMIRDFRVQERKWEDFELPNESFLGNRNQAEAADESTSLKIESDNDDDNHDDNLKPKSFFKKRKNTIKGGKISIK